MVFKFSENTKHLLDETETNIRNHYAFVGNGGQHRMSKIENGWSRLLTTNFLLTNMSNFTGHSSKGWRSNIKEDESLLIQTDHLLLFIYQ